MERADSLLDYARPYWRRLGFIIALSVLGTLLSLALPYLSKRLVDDALLGRDWAALLSVVAAFFALTAASYFLNMWSGLRYTRVSAEILFEMRLALYRHLQSLSPRFWARTRLGEVLSRLNSDIGEVQRVAAETALAWAGNVLFLVGSAAMMLWLNPLLFLVSIAALPPSIVVLRRYRQRMEAKAAVLRQSSADIGSFLVETLMGVRLAIASNAQEREVERFRSRNDGFLHALIDMQRTSYLLGGLPGLILAAGSAAVFLCGGWLVIEGRMTMGTLVAFLAYHMRLTSPVQALMGMWANLATARVSLGRVRELLQEKPEVVERPEAPPLDRARGEIAFEHVSFSFDRGEPVLQDVSFEAAPGDVVAIVGPSGSGKSTIADLLIRLLDPDRGVVRLDGRDLRELRLADIRSNIALVEQEPFLLHASIAENLRYMRPSASDADLEFAARTAGLGEFIASLPEGMATIVGERGLAVSTGEKQRIALARALLADAPVLVLDEPTAALDAETESQVVAGYEEWMRGRTVIVITHRVEVARRAARQVALCR